MTENPGFTPLSDAEWPAEIASLRSGFAGTLNVYRVMARNAPLLAAWENLRNHVVLAGNLPPREKEIVILRTGFRLGSHYEWAHHVMRGRQVGLSEADIERVAGQSEAWQAGSVFGLLVKAVDQLLDSARLNEETIAQLCQHIGPPGMLDLMATVGMYATLAFVTNSFEVPLEAQIGA